jgi:hypothetical protein
MNYGTYTEVFNVTIYANATVIDIIKGAILEAKTSTVLNFTWHTDGFAIGNYTISAYVSQVSGETDAGDNTFTTGFVTLTIPGDISGDYKATLSDLVLLAIAYGSHPGYSNWNPNADMDDNGVVGLSDLVILALHYGQHYP